MRAYNIALDKQDTSLPYDWTPVIHGRYANIMNSHHQDIEFNAARDSPGYLLWLMSNKWQAEQRLALKPFELTHVQFVLLACLVYAPGNESLTQIQLAERAETDPMMTSQVLRKLEVKGLVRRMSSTQDKRAVSLEATAKGAQLVDRAIMAVEAVDREFFGVLEADIPNFVVMMRKLVWTPRNNLAKTRGN
ncbi:MAG TPA: MarR family transcriptional regulator [Candidatus Saccharimonadia bacterium]|nr:MarR family transcriptional regulator [Candidatus Saccharimonadia bacterium]